MINISAYQEAQTEIKQLQEENTALKARLGPVKFAPKKRPEKVEYRGGVWKFSPTYYEYTLGDSNMPVEVMMDLIVAGVAYPIWDEESKQVLGGS